MSTCQNKFLEEDGFYSQCGKNHLKLERSTPAAPRKNDSSKVSKQDLIQAGIEANPVYATAKSTVELLAGAFDLDVRVIFRNVKQSYYTKENHKHLIVLGYQSLDSISERGFSEYASCSYLVRGTREERKGTKGAEWLAAHEFAHALTNERDGYVQPHGTEYQYHYREVIKVLF